MGRKKRRTDVPVELGREHVNKFEVGFRLMNEGVLEYPMDEQIGEAEERFWQDRQGVHSTR